MDEMKIESKFLTRIISDILTKQLKKSKNVNIRLNISSVKASIKDGKVNLDLSGSVQMTQEELARIMNPKTRNEDD